MSPCQSQVLHIKVRRELQTLLTRPLLPHVLFYQPTCDRRHVSVLCPLVVCLRRNRLQSVRLSFARPAHVTHSEPSPLLSLDLSPISVILLTPIQARLTRMGYTLQRASRKASDERTSVLSECLHSIKTIKLGGWDKLWLDKVDAAREKELKLSMKGQSLARSRLHLSNADPC